MNTIKRNEQREKGSTEKKKTKKNQKKKQPTKTIKKEVYKNGRVLRRPEGTKVGEKKKGKRLLVGFQNGVQSATPRKNEKQTRVHHNLGQNHKAKRKKKATGLNCKKLIKRRTRDNKTGSRRKKKTRLKMEGSPLNSKQGKTRAKVNMEKKR